MSVPDASTSAQSAAAALAAQVDPEQRTARGLAAAVAGLIRREQLPVGSRLPTVRSLAAELGVSPATVSEAWSLLRSRGALTGSGRNGVRVSGAVSTPHPARFERVGNYGDGLAVDLTLAGPDVALLPPLEAALVAATEVADLHAYRRDAITPELQSAVAPRWPFVPDAWMATDSGFQGLMLVLQTTVVPGDHVAVENPTTPRLLDILDLLGANVVPVTCDSRGPLPDSLAAALRRRPAAFVYQPRAQSPLGSAVDPERSGELAAVLDGTETLVLEDDGAGEVASAPLVSLGSVLPDRTVLVRSYSKSHGPDLRVAVLAGAAAAVERARVRRTYGSGWTSRLLQMALVRLLADPATEDLVARARQVYGHRRETVAAALQARGVPTSNRDGLSLWVPVRDERSALVTLAARSIAASPGDRFAIGRYAPHLRVATGGVIDDLDWLADALALAAAGR